MKKIKIIEQIRSGKIKMKPKWIFELEKIGVWGVWLLIVSLAAVSLNAIYYFLRVYNPAEWLPFGEIGFKIFYEDFPYLWLLVNIIFLAAGWVILSKIGDNYKKKWWVVGAMVILVVLVLSTGLTLFLGR